MFLLGRGRFRAFPQSFSHRLSVRLFSDSVTKPSEAPYWSLGVLNHVAIATPNLDKSSYFYASVAKAKVSEKIPLPDHGVTTVFVDLGNTKIELLHPLGDKSPISGFLKKNPRGGIHHICIEVDHLEAACKTLTDSGITALSDKPSIGAHGKPVVFFHPKDLDGVLLELEQKTVTLD